MEELKEAKDLLKAIHTTLNDDNLTDSEKIKYIKDYYEVVQDNQSLKAL